MNTLMPGCESGRHRARRIALPALLVSLFIATPIATFTACSGEEPVPTYAVQNTTLRLVPEQQTITQAGGSVFVLLEFARNPDGGSTKPVLSYVRVEGASIAPLPGPAACGDDGAGGAAEAGSADATGPDGDAADTGADVSSSSSGSGEASASTTLTLPYSALLDDGVRHVREAGFVLHVPAGADDVLIVATAYEHDGDPGACVATPSQSVAVASTRIVRAKPDAGAADSASGVDADVESGAEAGVPVEAGTDTGIDAATDASDDMDASSNDGGAEAG